MPEQLSEEDSQAWRDWQNASRAMIDEEAALGNENTLDITIDSHVWALTSQAQSGECPQFLDLRIHELVYTIIQAAKNFDWTSNKQDEIILILLRAREFGSLARPIRYGATDAHFMEPVMTTNGAHLWRDLPCLVEDIEQTWFEQSLNMTVSHRANFIAFIGRLVSVGISDRLSVCALQLFHDALEVPRRLNSADLGSEIPIVELLHAIDAWLHRDNYKTMMFSLSSVYFQGELAGPGELACSAGVTTGGFNPARRLFWMTRLQDIACSVQSEDYRLTLRIISMLDDFRVNMHG